MRHATSSLSSFISSHNKHTPSSKRSARLQLHTCVLCGSSHSHTRGVISRGYDCVISRSGSGSGSGSRRQDGMHDACLGEKSLSWCADVR